MENEVKIYVATHKMANFPKQDIYIPLHVGAEGKEDLGYLKDNTGDNISIKNKNYCELTATYWIMKNDNSDIVGLTHYRRYFFKNIYSNSFKNILEKQEILEILKNYDIIVPKKTNLDYNVKKQYEVVHHLKDLEECKNIIKEKYPQYEQAFNKIMNDYKMHTCNMFISKKKLFNEYYTWLFDILFELEKRVDISNYDDYNKRIYGFLSERLFNVWLEKNKTDLKIKEFMVYNTDKTILWQTLKSLNEKLKGMKNKWLKRV